MAWFSPDEIIYNYGGLAGESVVIDGVTYTIDHVKTEKLSRQLSAHMTNGDVIPMNQDAEYDFPGHPTKEHSAPTKPKAKGRRKE